METKANNRSKNSEFLSDRKKKAAGKDIESYKMIFFEIGLVISLFIILAAFEWKSYDYKNNTLVGFHKEKPLEILPPIVKIEKPEPKHEKLNISLLKIVNKITDPAKEVNPTETFDEKKSDDAYNPIKIIEEPEIQDEEIFIWSETLPEFKGGEEERINFLRNNIVYPQDARERGIQGIVFIGFIVEKNGEISDVAVLRGIGGGCDEEAIRVVKMMPKWKPGLQRSKPVRVRLNMPIKFALSN